MILLLSLLLASASALSFTKRDVAMRTKLDGGLASRMTDTGAFDANRGSMASFESAPDYSQMRHEVKHDITNELGGR